MSETSNNEHNKSARSGPVPPKNVTEENNQASTPPESGGVDTQFNTISGKLQQLIKKQGRLQRENEHLREELEETRKKQAAYQQHILELEHRLNVLRMSTGDMPEKDKKQFEKTLNLYIREIDKCIAFLSQ
jgi:predicted  nucleic acid-binding Zn-ribbon protein